MAQKKKVKTRKRERKIVGDGKAFIVSTFNNTIVTLTDAGATFWHGAVPAQRVLKDRGKERRMLLNLPLRVLLLKRRIRD
jgi:ribosomal protein S11